MKALFEKEFMGVQWWTHVEQWRLVRTLQKNVYPPSYLWLIIMFTHDLQHYETSLFNIESRKICFSSPDGVSELCTDENDTCICVLYVEVKKMNFIWSAFSGNATRNGHSQVATAGRHSSSSTVSNIPEMSGANFGQQQPHPHHHSVTGSQAGWSTNVITPNPAALHYNHPDMAGHSTGGLPSHATPSPDTAASFYHLGMAGKGVPGKHGVGPPAYLQSGQAYMNNGFPTPDIYGQRLVRYNVWGACFYPKEG